MPKLIMHKTKQQEFNKEQFQIAKKWFEKETCTHIELLHTQNLLPATQNSRNLTNALNLLSNAIFYPRFFLTLSSLQNLYTNPTNILMYTQLTSF